MVDETKVNCMKQGTERFTNWLDCIKVNLLRILLTASWRSPTSRQEGRSGVTSCRGKWPPLGFLLLLYCQLDGFVYNVITSVQHPEAVMLQPTSKAVNEMPSFSASVARNSFSTQSYTISMSQKGKIWYHNKPLWMPDYVCELLKTCLGHKPLAELNVFGVYNKYDKM